MCDVPSIAVFSNESIEYFPGTASKFFLKLLVTIPVVPIIIIIIIIIIIRPPKRRIIGVCLINTVDSMRVTVVSVILRSML